MHKLECFQLAETACMLGREKMEVDKWSEIRTQDLVTVWRLCSHPKRAANASTSLNQNAQAILDAKCGYNFKIKLSDSVLDTQNKRCETQIFANAKEMPLIHL